MSINFPELISTPTTSVAVSSVGGVEKYSTLDGGSVTVSNLNAGTVFTASLVVGTNVGLGTAQDSAGVTTIVGNTITTSYVNALNVTAQSVSASWVYAGNVVASQIVSGTITVGGTNQPTSLIIQESSLTGNSRLGWQHGSRMWEDSSSRLGVNSIGSPMYIYVDSTERLVIPSSGQTTVRGGVYADGNLNVTGNTRLNQNLVLDYDNIQFSGGDKQLTLRDFGITISNDASGRRQLNMGGYTFSIDASAGSPWFHVNGNDKSAIVPTSKGYNALYCAEAPEVWFFDFCHNKEIIDPMFLEVTEGPMKFIRLEDGEYQVWRRRKGHAYKRFEPKTAKEFEKNEQFLSMAKV